MIFETWVMTSVVLFAGVGGKGFGSTSILRLARLLRLSRMARMARLLRAMPELMILIKGMVAAMRSVVLTVGFLSVILYVFSIFLVQLCDGSECQAIFPTVLETMHSLLLNVVLMDSLASMIHPLQKQNPALMLLLYIFILVASLLLMNMLIGVICEVVSAVAAAERAQMDLAFVREKITELMSNYGSCDDVDKDFDGRISKAEFDDLLRNEKALAILSEVGVDGVSLLDLQDTLFAPDSCTTPDEDEDEDWKKLTFTEFMETILDLRGGNSTTVKDIVQLRKHIDNRFARLEERVMFLQEGGNDGITVAPSRKRNTIARKTLSKGRSQPSKLEQTAPPQEGGNDAVVVVSHEHGTIAGTSLSNVAQVAANTSSQRLNVEQTAPFLDIASSLQGLAATMVSAHEHEVAVLREQSVEVAALREQNATLKAKLEKLQRYKQSMPLGAMCNIEVPDGADEDRLNGHIPADTGLDEPRDKDVFVCSQWAMDVGSFFSEPPIRRWYRRFPTGS